MRKVRCGGVVRILLLLSVIFISLFAGGLVLIAGTETNSVSGVTNGAVVAAGAADVTAADRGGLWSDFRAAATEKGHTAGRVVLVAAVAIVCLFSLFVSLLAFSGCWLILLAGIGIRLLTGEPGWLTLGTFAVISIAGELFEGISSFHGVKKRGGSGWAGFAGFIGAILGGIAGSAVLPLVGTLVGLLLGTFVAVFLVEYQRLQHSGQAHHIAMGAFISRLAVLGIKTASAFVMSIWLLWSLISA